MSLSYAKEKLHVAVRTLAVSTDDIQNRLADAYSSSLSLIGKDDLPADLQEELTAIHQQITRVPAKGDEGTIRATVNTMSDDECLDLADKIFDMYSDVNRLFYKP